MPTPDWFDNTEFLKEFEEFFTKCSPKHYKGQIRKELTNPSGRGNKELKLDFAIDDKHAISLRVNLKNQIAMIRAECFYFTLTEAQKFSDFYLEIIQFAFGIEGFLQESFKKYKVEKTPKIEPELKRYKKWQ